MQRNWMYALGLIGLAMGLLSTGCNPDGTPFTLQPAPAPQALSGKTETPPEYAKTEVIEPEPETKDPLVAEVDPEAAAFLERLNGFENRDEKQSETVEVKADAVPALVPQNINNDASPSVDPSVPATNTAIDLAMVEPAEPEHKPDKPVVVNVAVRTTPDQPEADEPDETIQSNSALTIQDTQPAHTLDTMVAMLQDKIEADPNDIESQWRMSMLLAAMGRYDEAATVSDQIAGDAAQMITDAVQTVESVRLAVLEPGVATDSALDHVNALRSQLIRDAELQIPKVALCTKVSTFGVYDVMDPGMLVPYRANRAIVYCEVKNFLADQAEGDTWRVDLSSRLEIMTSDGDSLWRHEQPDIVDNARQRREDFFLAQLVTFPSTLGPGEYVLKVSIEDKAAAKACEAVFPFTIGSPIMTASN